jgi:tRNA threonylcarbamoyladenosine biosynthesis protein TsaE
MLAARNSRLTIWVMASDLLPTAQLSIESATPAETETFGQALGQRLFPGAVVALVGPLGAGKTALARAIAVGLGVANPVAVTSPTFVLIQEYAARLPIYHFDVYRLRCDSDLLDLGAEEYLFGEGICLIEWADKVEALLPKEHLQVEMQALGETSRHLAIRAWGERYAEMVRSLAKILIDKK